MFNFFLEIFLLPNFMKLKAVLLYERSKLAYIVAIEGKIIQI